MQNPSSSQYFAAADWAEVELIWNSIFVVSHS